MKQQSISLDNEVQSENVSIPTQCDLTLGLSPTEGYRRYFLTDSDHSAHVPIKGVDIMYPFLLVEAKREENAPGFRSLERQTSFPLRRLLKAQDYLQSLSGAKFDPLVWFFGYQGEVWRLYAGVMEGSAVVSSPAVSAKLHQLRLTVNIEGI